ncbi:MAG: hypothetical protein ACYCS7_14975, partial [Acidimicrobiales bacterium]
SPEKFALQLGWSGKSDGQRATPGRNGPYGGVLDVRFEQHRHRTLKNAPEPWIHPLAIAG